MKYMEEVLLLLLAYIVVSFALASFNFITWGVIGRVAYIALAIVLIVINRKFDV